MKFLINYTGKVENKNLIYRADEFSFDMYPRTHLIDFEVAINTLTLAIIENQVVHLSGFCGLRKDMKRNYDIPENKEGLLKVTGNFESGLCYRINKEDWPVHINIHTGWVCIGNPTESFQSVEFIKNCVAVLNHKGNIMSLWLKPDKLPKL